jgi:branched-chain amino acid transport system substrate-binding protein
MKFSSKLILSLAIVTLAGCLTAPKVGDASEPLVIGILQNENYAYATMMKNSFEMALEVINKGGGIKGQPVKLVYANDQGSRREGEEAVKELIKKTGAAMLIGGYSSSNTLYMARMADKMNTPFLVCTAADDRITQRKLGNVYRLNSPASEYARGLESLLLEDIKPASMAILYENSPYGTGGALRMMWFCRENDIKIRQISPYHKERAKNEKIASAYFQKIIAPLKEDPPDMIYMVSYLRDAVFLVKRIRELKIESLLCGGAGGFTHNKFTKMAGDAATNVLTATLWFHQLKYPGTKEYYNQYLQKYSVPPDYHGAEAYSALLVAADALKRAESYRPESIRAALDQTDMTTPFGPVKFDSYGKFERQNSLPTMVLQIIEGKFECVWPPDLATSKFIPPPHWRPSESK